MLWTSLLSLALPVYAEVSLSTATEAAAISTVPAAAAVSSAPELGPESLPATFYFKDGSRLEGRWRMHGLVLELPQGPLHTSADLLQRIEFTTGTATVPPALPPTHVAAPPAPAPAGPPPAAPVPAVENAAAPRRPLLESFLASAYKSGGMFGGAVRRPSGVVGWNAGFSFRPASERWEGRLEGGMYSREELSLYYFASNLQRHAQKAGIKYGRISGSRLIRLGGFSSLKSLVGVIPCTLRLGGGVGFYQLKAEEHHAYYQGINTISTYEPMKTWNEITPHLDAGFNIQLHRRVELQLSAEFIASKTHVAGYRYGGFSKLLQLAIR